MHIYKSGIDMGPKKEKPLSSRKNILYTDGSCTKNGSKYANAGLGILIHSSLFCDKIKIGKRLEPKTFVYDRKKYTYMVSNIRAEGYAIIYSLFLFKLGLIDRIPIGKNTIINVLHTNHLPPLSSLKIDYTSKELVCGSPIPNQEIHIYTDSQFWINVFTKWMPNWILEDKMLEKKNVDILLYGHYLLTILRQNQIQVHFHHVRAHQKGNALDEHAMYNNEVDRVACDANKPTSNYNFHVF